MVALSGTQISGCLELLFCFFFNRLYIFLEFEVHSKMEQKVQRIPIRPWSPPRTRTAFPPSISPTSVARLSQSMNLP